MIIRSTRICILLSFLLSGGCASSAISSQEKTSEPVRSVEPADPGYSLDFGPVRQGEIKEEQFTFTNRKDHKVKIKEVRACCGYSVSDVKPWEIEPGASSVITIQIDATRKYVGHDEKTVTILTEGQRLELYKIAVSADIIGKDQK